MVNLGFGFGSARTAVESRLWSSQGCRFPSSRAAAVSFASRHVVATTYQERKWRGRESKDEELKEEKQARRRRGGTFHIKDHSQESNPASLLLSSRLFTQRYTKDLYRNITSEFLKFSSDFQLTRCLFLFSNTRLRVTK